ncbi:hypothetical protein C1645_840131 [Glomus cerebriforme]|uniref:Uncharacterized protein n=1 Tax=Glomus cerebriforme TaxID=658196 RepID=A0A397SAF2_9GLOM|nr:hypothetical protein C1645_840131 [Glomus cerebriforme]
MDIFSNRTNDIINKIIEEFKVEDCRIKENFTSSLTYCSFPIILSPLAITPLSNGNDTEMIKQIGMNEKSIDSKDFNKNQVEISSKEITSKRKSDLPTYDENDG